jgi:hypothetical protein
MKVTKFTLKIHTLSPVYTIQVLHPRKLGSSLCIHDAKNLMNTHKFWWEIQQTKWHFWEERRVLPFVLHYYVQLYCEGD